MNHRSTSAVAVAVAFALAGPFSAGVGPAAARSGAAAPPPRTDSVTGLGERTSVTTPSAPSPDATDRAIRCGSAADLYKYSTRVAFWTVDVFRHANRTYACEDGNVITQIYEGQNDCQKYAWGLTYFSRKAYHFSPTHLHAAFGLAECSMSVGGQISHIGVIYTKQSNTKHTFIMRGGGAVVSKEHWTTTP
ncbi:MAG: hypothetical protein JWN46_1175 [Acidimicrobiales bacterium]|nr:hypothetical protein [Acidimicrobiales bacterium]